MKNAVINGTGSYLPEQILTNAELEKQLDTSDEWIVSRTGIQSRRIAGEHETTSYMASKAASAALRNSGLKPDDIDLILVATCTPNQIFPSMACCVQNELNITRTIPAFDISAACSGFIYAMDVAWQYIRSGAAKHIMVVGSESMSRAVDWTDRSTCILFGDGAGAVVLSASDHREGILGSTLHSVYDKDMLLTYPNFSSMDEKAFIGMKGNDVFKIAVNIMSDIVDEVLSSSQLQKSDIKWLVPHQANIRIIQAIAKKLSLPMSQVVVTIDYQGNTSAASIPLALDYAIRQNRIKHDDIILLESFGGGMTWGAMVIKC
ncbi:ketoacyl-ACP synthase III [Legionella israelensis]|uniref:Beta-ketoacyl-[acyl-carrier-protein] synthase III n=1 Tax=Legionella israelensis TaxID=454 RepID=A0A0W0VH46_9GAMM|nr:beta-ketoacyl-ACP synthase III [Legionella israelensis]KTD19477.1 3-oxoacyl-ACP synthase [Legionella israelensis]QBR84163.1 ketoacyl-ACP synthase III [Legionella israelensis]QBS08415.1 ketoacyl-ACP synthase III [Legionella israelensis]SCX91733.1 3-oxoacyl-[acyl-carrier-protein] synthase III [Legionella israelensis DSM 19235]STX58051.1 3-oxoacyl-(acyl-carrier-protein) [Legionella israelensis]